MYRQKPSSKTILDAVPSYTICERTDNRAYLNNSIASRMTLGARKPSPVLPLTQLSAIVFVPLVNVPDGMAKLYTSPNPRYAPRVSPLESILVGAAGVVAVQEFTTTPGRQLANASVVPTRSVEPVAPVNLMVSWLVPLTSAIGTLLRLEEPTV